ncbi:hypothetical protein KDL01_29425 [Actinospica durhamensis]|uniref:D-alanine--D-alanine ligase C-terminal domain-containing protein n=1 Tax=Actinospica durhamensis TaxID=1508375 RepID=A0A941EUB5_9ACTN|nr:hypothetical protein [Actinospica durhamensis]MBR7837436.1 hypothetical protein [Actinospica durhamensis]
MMIVAPELARAFDGVLSCWETRVAAAAARVGYPVVVNPRVLGSSFGVALARDERELAEAYQRRRPTASPVRGCPNGPYWSRSTSTAQRSAATRCASTVG